MRTFQDIKFMALRRKLLKMWQTLTVLTAQCMQSSYKVDVRFDEKVPDMLSLAPEQLTSIVEQICHSLEDQGPQMQHLHIQPRDDDLDPEEDHGSITAIYDSIISSFPTQGLSLDQIKTKARIVKEIAVDVGLSNVGILISRKLTPSASLLPKLILPKPLESIDQSRTLEPHEDTPELALMT